jgi:hypothetical protein
MDPKPNRLRLLAVLLAGPAALVVLFLAFYLHYHWANGGMTGWLADSLKLKPIREFGIQYAFKILLPIYTITGIALWLLTLIPMRFLDRSWSRSWTPRQAFLLILTAFAWLHACLWWQVPTTLWNIPVLGRIPFILLFPLMAAFPIAMTLLVLRGRGWGWGRRIVGLAAFLLVWAVPGWIPQVLPRLGVPARGGDQSCKVLLVGLDGLRSDVFLEHAGQMKGLRYENSYTPIPATRLLWHILWGGDPLFYTVGHVGPSMEEYEHPEGLTLLKEASEKGLRPRFYIDDGGTIGLAERQMDLDDSLSPAEGWENFVNSNLAVSFPLYAVWENWFKPFPTTNPWAPLDAGLKEALRLGQGSGWVMFHSCLAHQPIYLNRQELHQTGRWWSLCANDYYPIPNKYLVLKTQAEHPDPRTNPFLAYQIRMNAILRAWEPIWNRLDQDPSYKNAARVMFSDHGERFHNVGPNGFQLIGIHGYGLDAWECRTAMLMAGPGFSDQVETAPRQTSVSLLGLRDGTRRIIQGTGAFDAPFFENAYPVAPIRYHTLDDSAYATESGKYRQMSDKEIAANSYMADHGVWITQYGKTAEERAKDVSVGLATGPDLWIYKPLEGGGAHELHFKGYDLQKWQPVDESVYQAKKRQVESLMPPLTPMPQDAVKKAPPLKTP